MASKSFVGLAAAVSLTFSSTAAVAAAPATSAALPSACAAAVTAGAAAATQAVRPGCVLPAIDTGVPVSTETIPVEGSPGMAGWILPVLGLAGLAALIFALKKGGGDGEGSLSNG